jgi:hypothetical protein
MARGHLTRQAGRSPDSASGSTFTLADGLADFLVPHSGMLGEWIRSPRRIPSGSVESIRRDGQGHLLLLAQLAVSTDDRRDHVEVLLSGQPQPWRSRPAGASAQMYGRSHGLVRIAQYRPPPSPGTGDGRDLRVRVRS